MNRLLTILMKADNIFYKGQKVLILAGVVAMLIINGAQIFCRYVLHSSLFWSEQVSVILYFVLIMLGANLAVKVDGETKIDILKFKSEKKNAVLGLITDVLCCIALAVFLASTADLLKITGSFPQYVSSIRLNYIYIYVWLAVGFFLVLVDKIVNICKRLCILTGTEIPQISAGDDLPDEEDAS